MRNSKGFSLIEVLAALAVMTIVVATVVPSLIHVYRERATIQEKRQALEMLHNRTQKWLANEGDAAIYDDTVKKGVVTYSFTVKNHDSDGKLTLCVSWTGSNERGYHKCEIGRAHV